ncbi:beta-lactamase-like protein [Aspergillus pseudodeflectus]|uniref:Beta-lactamase-like protein n=1 Tax=Aspergillus pseudodeflectus TaxID=176178 RepID=A0ABR4JA50_9EURO
MSFYSTNMPNGAKLWLLDLGSIDLDAANVLAGRNQFAVGLAPQPHERRDLIMIAALIYHPHVGLVLFDTGSCEDIITSWGAKTMECSPRNWDKSVHGLAEAIRATGAGEITDVKAVVMSHLHCDHAGGLEHFLDTEVEIWCHEDELKNAFWACATRVDQGPYLKDYLSVDRLNWRTFTGKVFEVFPGIILHHCPGHTTGSIAMQVNLEKAGTVLLTGDAFHVKENWEEGIAPGTLTRDWNEWHRSRNYLRSLAQARQAKVILGHERAYFKRLRISPEYTE